MFFLNFSIKEKDNPLGPSMLFEVPRHMGGSPSNDGHQKKNMEELRGLPFSCT
jgi:hypothetical protein